MNHGLSPRVRGSVKVIQGLMHRMGLSPRVRGKQWRLSWWLFI